MVLAALPRLLLLDVSILGLRVRNADKPLKLAFIPINIGYLIAYVSYFPWIRRDEKIKAQKGPDYLLPERRLKWLLYLAPLETLGLFGHVL